MKKIILIPIIMLVLVSAAYGIPYRLDWQGVLRNSTNGSTMLGSYSFNITYYNASDDNMVYTENKSITTNNGVWDYILGETNPILPQMFRYSLYARAKINNDLLDVMNVTPSPYSFYSWYANDTQYFGGQLPSYYTSSSNCSASDSCSNIVYVGDYESNISNNTFSIGNLSNYVISLSNGSSYADSSNVSNNTYQLNNQSQYMLSLANTTDTNETTRVDSIITELGNLTTLNTSLENVCRLNTSNIGFLNITGNASFANNQVVITSNGRIGIGGDPQYEWINVESGIYTAIRAETSTSTAINGRATGNGGKAIEGDANTHDAWSGYFDGGLGVFIEGNLTFFNYLYGIDTRNVTIFNTADRAIRMKGDLNLTGNLTVSDKFCFGEGVVGCADEYTDFGNETWFLNVSTNFDNITTNRGLISSLANATDTNETTRVNSLSTNVSGNTFQLGNHSDILGWLNLTNIFQWNTSWLQVNQNYTVHSSVLSAMDNLTSLNLSIETDTNLSNGGHIAGFINVSEYIVTTNITSPDGGGFLIFNSSGTYIR